MDTSKKKKRAIWDKSEGHCWYCGVVLIWRDDSAKTPGIYTQPNAFVIDHFIAKAHGGTNHITNLVPACTRCNWGKRTRSVEAFRQRGGPNMAKIPYFSERQIAFLHYIGIPLPDSFPSPTPVVFWFEQQGLKE